MRRGSPLSRDGAQGAINTYGWWLSAGGSVSFFRHLMARRMVVDAVIDAV
jgi:hypothetical protein